MDMQARVDQALRFLRTNYEGRTATLARATITDRGKTTQTFHEGSGRLRTGAPTMLEGLVRGMIKKSDQGTEIFYAPTPMSGNKGRKKEQALPNVVVFGDADEGLTDDSKAKLVELGACLVRSGGKLPSGRPKYHVYLLLTREVPPAELEALNRGLKAFIRGDKFDSTTLLRLPGTRNHKYPGSPLVTVERYADARHTPENLIKFLGVEHTAEASSVTKLTLPKIPEDFNWLANRPGYARVRKSVREWNGRFNAGGNIRRYMATIAIVKDSLRAGLSIDEAYGFASVCEPLLDKVEEENGYRIEVDVARTWRREAGMKPSGTLTAEDIVSARQTQDAKNKTTTPPPVSSAPSASSSPPGTPVRLEFGPGFPFARPNLDELLSGDYKPLEPTLVTCGEYFLLYPGKSHGLSSDRGLGKTHVTIAMIHDIMKRGGRVAYFDFEDTPDTFIRDRMMNQHGITEDMIRNQFLYLGGIDIQAQEDMEAITPTDGIRMMAEHLKGWDLVVIDGVSASMNDWSVDKESPSPMLDGSKATDYAWWHNRQVKPFLDQGIATLQIDHSTKQGGRVGGTIQKGAKLTGVEYELRPEKIASTLVMGGTGRLVLAAVKDRVGRIIRYKRRHVNDDETQQWNDVATFVMTSNVEGKVSHASFEPINGEQVSGSGSEETVEDTPLTESETRILDVLKAQATPMTRYALRQATKLNNQRCTNATNSLITRGLVAVDSDNKIIPVVGTVLDFSRADKMPRGAKRQVECQNCGDSHTYPDDFPAPDDLGYKKGRRWCKDCAAEGIQSESPRIPRDGAEWARKMRGRIDRSRRTRGDSQRS